MDLLCCFSSNNSESISDCKSDRKNQIFTQSCRETLELGAGVQSGAPPDSSAWSRIKKLSLANKAQNGFAAPLPCTQLTARLKAKLKKVLKMNLKTIPETKAENETENEIKNQTGKGWKENETAP